MSVKKVSKRIPVLVTTQHRGVFFGFADPSDVTQRSFTLTKCRCCISWAASIGGFLGLAKTGPNKDCKIGAEALSVLVHDVTSVSDCSPEAVEAWTKA